MEDINFVEPLFEEQSISILLMLTFSVVFSVDHLLGTTRFTSNNTDD
jgi:hypothetical protein